ncbi:MAG: VCBS repeat-containing protein [Pelobacteraceae bacterium]
MKIRLFYSVLFAICFIMLGSPAFASSKVLLKVSINGNLAPGEAIYGWQADIVLPAGVSIATGPPDANGLPQIDPSSFFLSGVALTEHIDLILGSYDSSINVIHLALLSYNTGITSTGEVATLVFDSTATNLTANNFGVTNLLFDSPNPNLQLSLKRVDAVKDFNGDGKPDILWQNASTGDLYVWNMNGITMTNSSFVANVQAPWVIATVADFNGDGKPDILWKNATTNEYYIWNMNGITMTSSSYVATVPTPWVIATVADFNEDGKPDILWKNATTNEYYVWYMDGIAMTSSNYVAYVPTPWVIATVADFNGDGKPDILWKNAATNEYYVWYMNGIAMTSSSYVAYVPTPWVIATVADFNGDGKPDILWKNAVTNEYYIWYIDGITMTSSSYVAYVPTPWDIVNN